MKPAALITLVLCLSGCGIVPIAGGNFKAITTCAKQHPAPPQANVDRLGLMSVYTTHAGDVNDPAVKAWFATMDKCTADYEAAQK